MTGLIPPQDQLLNLIEAARRGDDAACNFLYHQFVQPVFRLAYGVLLNRQDAEEVVQDSFTYAFQNLRRFDPARSAFKTWLYTITMSRCRNKRRRKWLPTISLPETGEVVASSSPHPEALATGQDAREALFAALRKLSPKLREAVVLHYFDGLSFREMAQVIGCPQKTAESRVRLAHEALYRLMADQYDVLFEGAFEL